MHVPMYKGEEKGKKAVQLKLLAPVITVDKQLAVRIPTNTRSLGDSCDTLISLLHTGRGTFISAGSLVRQADL